MIRITQISIERHRNGICGSPFHFCKFSYVDPVNGVPEPRELFATVFEAKGHVAVFDPSNLDTKFRGDFFEPKLRLHITGWETARAA